LPKPLHKANLTNLNGQNASNAPRLGYTPYRSKLRLRENEMHCLILKLTNKTYLYPQKVELKKNNFKKHVQEDNKIK